MKLFGPESRSCFVEVYTDWSTWADKGVTELTGDGIDSEAVKVEPFAVAGELTVESSAVAVEFSRGAMSGKGLSLSETVKSTWDCSSFSCLFIFRVLSSIFGNKDSKPLDFIFLLWFLDLLPLRLFYRECLSLRWRLHIWIWNHISNLNQPSRHLHVQS